MPKVAILGAGNLAWTLAGALLLRSTENYDVTVWAPPKHRTAFNQVAATGRLELTGPIAGQFTPPLENDLSKAINSAHFIVITVPTLGHAGILDALANHDLSMATVIALPGSGFTLAAKRLLHPDLSPKVILETTTSPYACRRNGNAVAILGLKRQVEIAASKELDKISKAEIASLFPQPLQWYRDVASIFFSNTNPVAHPAGILQAKETIEGGVRPLPPFYRTFVAGAIDVVLAVDRERLAIVQALGLQSETDFDYSKKWYGTDAADSKAFYQIFEGYAKIETPDTINHRYLHEDVKYIMVLWEDIASVCGVKVPTMKWIIDTASDALKENFRETGRTLSSLGLTRVNKKVILSALNGV